jgi:hypothetical protein
MPQILMWTGSEISGLEKAWGLACVLTEVDDEGMVTREIGFDAQGKIIHRCPGEPTVTEYGVFDLAKIAPSRDNDMSAEEFERLWSSGQD